MDAMNEDSGLLEDVLRGYQIPPVDIEEFEGDDLLPYADQLLGPGGLANLEGSCEGAGQDAPMSWEDLEPDMEFDIHAFLSEQPPSLPPPNAAQSSTNVANNSEKGANLNDDRMSGNAGGAPSPSTLQESGQGSGQIGGNVNNGPQNSGNVEKEGDAGNKNDNDSEGAAERKRKIRRERNRENAHNSRVRKKMYLEQLQNKCEALEKENYQLKLENTAMKHQLSTLFQQQQTGGLAAQPAIPQFPFTPVCPPLGNLPMYAPNIMLPNTAKLPLWPVKATTLGKPGDGTCTASKEGVSDTSGSTDVPANTGSCFTFQGEKEKGKRKQGGRKGRQTRRESENSNSPQSGHAASPSNEIGSGSGIPGHVQKKTKVAVVAGVLATMCVFAAFLGPGLMLGQSTVQSTGGGLMLGGGGRQLQGISSGEMRQVEFGNPQPLLPSISDGSRVEEPAEKLPDWASGSFSLQYPENEDFESKGLTKLKELGPLAVLVSDIDLKRANRRFAPLATGWQNYTELANEVFSAAGFQAPATCSEVFRFDASQVSNLKAARERMQTHVMSMATFRGFPEGPIPLPPGNWKEADANVDEGGSEERVGKDEMNSTGVIVSVFVPTRENERKAGILTAVQRIYVVVLQPLATYVTFACPLSFPVFA